MVAVLYRVQIVGYLFPTSYDYDCTDQKDWTISHPFPFKQGGAPVQW